MDKKRSCICILSTLALIVFLFMVNMALGSTKIPASDIIKVISGKSNDVRQTGIIMNIRLPRAVSAMLTGGALALSGYLLQTFFGNPIVGPYVLGISQGAKLFVALTLILFLDQGKEPGLDMTVLAAFAGAFLTMCFVLIVSVRVRNMSILVVCGIMIGYICSAVTDFAVTFADDSNIVNLHNWSMGSLSGINWDEIEIMTVIAALCLLISISVIKPMNAYRLGESYAMSVGVNIIFLRIRLIFAACLLAACVTAFAGPISFVGIAVPHLVRSIMKTDSSEVMVPACFLGGTLTVLFCDLFARRAFAPAEVSISSVTAVFLVPVIIYLMIHCR